MKQIIRDAQFIEVLDLASPDGKTSVHGFPGKFGENGRVCIYEKNDSLWELAFTISHDPMDTTEPTFGKHCFLNQQADKLCVSAPGRSLYVYFFNKTKDSNWEDVWIRQEPPVIILTKEADLTEGVDFFASSDLENIYFSSVGEGKTSVTAMWLENDAWEMKTIMSTENIPQFDKSVPLSLGYSYNGDCLVYGFRNHVGEVFTVAVVKNPKDTPRISQVFATGVDLKEKMDFFVMVEDDIIQILSVPRTPQGENVVVRKYISNLKTKQFEAYRSELKHNPEFFIKYGRVVAI